MKKRILSILLLCCMGLTLLPTTAFAAETGAMDNIPAKFDVEIDLCGRTSDINIKDSKTYYIYSSSSDPDFVWTKKIQINGKKAAPHIFLDNVNIQVKKDAKTPAIELHGKASAYLYFINRDSKLTGATGRAAIQKNRSEGQLCVQVMKGTTVTCQGGYKAAGIGGSYATRNISNGYYNGDMYGHGVNMHFGSQSNPDYWGGTINATGGEYGAGIGAGSWGHSGYSGNAIHGGAGERLYFYSGTVNASGGRLAAGIGGGFRGRGSHIYIYGGNIDAQGGDTGAGLAGPLQRPALQVGRRVYLHFLPYGKNHDPFLGIFVPDDFRVTEVALRGSQDGISRILLEGLSVVKAIGHALHLAVACRCIESNDGTGTDRQILSGVHKFYEPEELVGKTCIAITNLPPRPMMGIDLSLIHI